MATPQDLMNEFYGPAGGGTPTATPTAPDVRQQLLNDAYPASAAPATGNGIPTPKPFTPEESRQAEINTASTEFSPGPERLLKKVTDRASTLPSRVWGTGVKNFGESMTQAAGGLRDVFMTNKKASGIGNVGMGLLGAVAAFPSAAIEEGIADPLSGVNPTFGKKAGFLSELAVPIVPGARIATAPSRRAEKSIVDAIGPANIPAKIQELKANPRLSLMDVSDPVRMMTQKLYTQTPGAHQEALSNFVKARTEGSKAAVKDAFDEAMGQSPNAFKKLKAMQEEAQRVGNDLIQPAIKGAGPVNVQPIIKYLDDIIKPTIANRVAGDSGLPTTQIIEQAKDIRKLLTNESSQQIDAATLHEFQKIMRADAQNLLNSTDGQARRMGHSLMQMRNQFVEAIDNASPKIKLADGTEAGSYRQSLSAYKDEMDIKDAFIKGHNILRNRGGQWDDHPDFVQQWVKGLDPRELEAAREGARLAHRDVVGNTRNPRGQAGTDIATKEFAIEKLEHLFGQKEIEQMTKKLLDERRIAASNDEINRNSMTAMRLASDARVPKIKDPNEPPDYSRYLPVGAELAATYLTGGQSMGAAAGAVIAANAVSKYAITPFKNRQAVKEASELAGFMQATGADADRLNRLLRHAPVPKLTMGQKLKLLTSP